MGLELIPSSDYIYCPTLYSCAYIGIEEVLFAQRLGKAERIPNRTSEVQLECQVTYCLVQSMRSLSSSLLIHVAIIVLLVLLWILHVICNTISLQPS